MSGRRSKGDGAVAATSLAEWSIASREPMSDTEIHNGKRVLVRFAVEAFGFTATRP